MAMPSTGREKGGEERGRHGGPAPGEAACGGGGSDGAPTHCCKREPHVPGTGHRAGVTSDEAENTPQLRVSFGEGSRRSLSQQGSARVKAHNARAQNKPPPGT